MEYMWFGGIAIYLVLLLTVCITAFRKGHTVLGVLGFFLPIFWLVGAIMSPTPTSEYGR